MQFFACIPSQLRVLIPTNQLHCLLSLHTFECSYPYKAIAYAQLYFTGSEMFLRKLKEVALYQNLMLGAYAVRATLFPGWATPSDLRAFLVLSGHVHLTHTATHRDRVGKYQEFGPRCVRLIGTACY